MASSRYWGIWTQGKLQILERYLERFVTTTRNLSPRHRVYLDLFAGRVENRDRITEQELRGSPRIALDISDPPFSRLAFFELGNRAIALENELRQRYPDRDFKVYHDANGSIGEALRDLHDVQWAPTFAFIDPEGADCHWSTLEALADHKRDRKYKVEMWILFPAALFQRQLRIGVPVPQRDAEQLTRMFGTSQWELIHNQRVAGEMKPREAREEYVNLMRWRLENVLGYGITHPFEVFNERGRPLYHMIFATDNDAGDRIMRSIYASALNEHPRMRVAARAMRARLAREEMGTVDMFSAAGIEIPMATGTDPLLAYSHEPPWTPPGTIED